MKKVTLQDIADSCGTSRVTVWKALNKETGISETLRTKIIGTALEMGYPLNSRLRGDNCHSPQFPVHSSAVTFQIALVVSRPETSVFWSRIITSISDYFQQNNCKMVFVCLPAPFDEDVPLPDNFNDGSIHGMVVMNIYEPRLFAKLNSLPIPKVFLDSITGMDFESINGDLFLIEGRSTVEKIVRHVIAQGCKRIGFIGDINYAQTNYERYVGYCSAMHAGGLQIPEEYCLTDSFGLYSAQLKINSFLESLPSIPDMLVCANDYIAHLTLQQLTLMGYSVPQDLMLSGFDDNFEFGHTSTLTTVHVQNTNMGIRLGNQILYHLLRPNADKEFIFIRSQVIFRASTGKIPE